MVPERIRARPARLERFLDSLGGVLARDVSPFAAWERRLRRPIVALLAMLAVAAVLAVFVNPAVVVACGALAGVIVVGYGWPALTIRGLSAELRLPAIRGVEGEALRATVAIRNAWPWPVWGVWLEGDLGERRTVALARLPARSTSEFTWDGAPQRRGEFPRGEVRIVTAFPFGLTAASRPVRLERRVLVWPATVALEALLGGGILRTSDEHFSDHRQGDVGDVSGTRPFRHGDALKKVHWPLSSRTGELVSCERQAPISAAVRVVVHPDPDGRDDGPTGTLESSLRIAASVCRAYHARHARVECRLGGDEHEIQPGQRGLSRFFDALARYEPAPARCPAARRGRGGRDGGTLQIVITTPGGMGRLSDQERSGPDRLLIVVEPADAEDAAPAAAPPRVVRLRSGRCLLDEFGGRWGRLCHV